MPEDVQPPPSPARRGLRFDVRWIVLAVALGLASAPLQPSWVALLVPAMSPLIGLISTIAMRTAGLALWIGIPGLLLGMFLPRGICRFACPLGPVLDACGRLRDGGPGRISVSTGRVLLGAMLGAAALGWPFLLWLDPFAGVNALGRMVRHPGSLAAVAAGLLVLIPLALSVWRPRSWCGRMCPLGAMQDIMTGLRRGASREASASTGGPAFPALSRREFLGVGAGVAAAAAARAAGATAREPVRPPGAVAGLRFGAVCIRCGNCAAACPSRIVHPDPGRHGLVSFLSPVLDFSKDYCRENCVRCTEVCPSGALTPLHTPAEKKAWRIGLAAADPGICLLSAGPECTACVTACPHDAISVVSDGFDTALRIDADACNGCGACETVCPVDPVRAIRVASAQPVR